MSVQTVSADAAIAQRRTPEGMFLRYCKARNDGLLLRQTMTLAGSLSIAVLASPLLGLLALVIALAGETLDWLTLNAILERCKTAGPLPSDRNKARLSALVQGGTIAACVTICWRLGGAHEAKFFAAAFLMSAYINAGLARRHFPEGAQARLNIYTVTCVVMVAADLFGHVNHLNVGEWYFLLSVGILAYTARMFIAVIERGHGERMGYEQALLIEQMALKQSQHDLAEEARNAQRLALMARFGNDSVIFTTPDGRIEWVNEAFSRSTGYSFEEAVGQFPGAILNSPNTTAESLEILFAAQRDGKPCRVEIQNRTKSGRMVWMEVSMTPILRADGTPEVFIAVERDITQAKAHGAELAAAREAAEQAAQAKSAFLATMSHEIRTPMNGVIGVAELMAETRLTKAQRHYVSTIIESGRALLTIINDILDLSKLQAGKGDIATEQFSLVDCVERAITLMRPSAQKKGIVLDVAFPDAVPDYLGAPGPLRQIFLNLIGNAVKFTEAGKVRITISVLRQEQHDQVSIAIADSGIGIAADRIGQVFEKFTQADSSITRQFGGTGLGLTISRLLAQQMGGDIEVSSIFGEGSVFTVTLPLIRVSTPKKGQSAARLHAPVTRLRLLIAEDNRTNMMIARKFLERSVASIAEAANGQIAVESYRVHPPDLVLMDVSMPVMDGIQATKEIRRHEALAGLRRCPILALTAYSSSEQADACHAAGMDGILTKPFVRADIYAALEKIAAETAFDVPPANAVDRASNGEQSWPISPRASGTTSGK